MSKDKTPSLFDYTPPPAQRAAQERVQENRSPAAATNSSSRGNAAEYSVTELSTALKRSIEDQFGNVRVRGELSRVTVAKSGHMYSSLKDDGAVLDAVCWRGTMQRLGLVPEEGMEVICTGKLTTYPGRSNYQLIIERMELAGEGALLKMLEERKKRLAAEGLFDERRKKALPFLPRCIGVVTSPTGAVIRDILHRITERFPSHVLLWPVMVQGEGAALQVRNAIKGFNNLPQGFDKPDVLIVARGGGSLEDLMPFNDEELVRSIAESDIPVISAVGHETDVTLVDFASDRRAPTPTGAAEMAVPVRSDWLYTVSEYEARMRRTASRQLQYNAERLKATQSFITLYPQYIEQKQQHIDFISTKTASSISELLSVKERRVLTLGSRLASVSPAELLHRQEKRLQVCLIDEVFKGLLSHKSQKSTVASARLVAPTRYLASLEKDIEQANKNFMRQITLLFDTKEQNIRTSSRMLETLSFKKVLERGFSVIRDSDGKVLSSVKAASQHDAVTAHFIDGDLELNVKK